MPLELAPDIRAVHGKKTQATSKAGPHAMVMVTFACLFTPKVKLLWREE